MIAETENKGLPLEHIRTDGGTQPRAELNQDVIQEYAQKMAEGSVFPPVVVFYDGTDYWLADGFHRYHGAKQAGGEGIAIEIRQGTRRDAVLYSVGANATHGLRRTNQDKQRAVETLLHDPEWSQWSNREIARRCAVDEWTVRKYKEDVSAGVPQGERKVERNGTVYTMNTANIGQQQKERETWLAPLPANNNEPPAPRYNPVPVLPPPILLPGKSATLAALQSSESNEWYTPSPYVEAARLLMGGIDLDPASCELANKVIQATTYYDVNTNGLDKLWKGRIWLNPPYGREGAESNQEVWSRYLMEQYYDGEVAEAVLLVNANTEARWFQPFYDRLICFTHHRIRFYTSEGVPNQPTQGNAFIYFGPRWGEFIELFSPFGNVVSRARRAA